MPCLDMATLTEPGPIHRQQLLVIGTVRLMAIQTVLCHGRMLPKKRSTLIGMALKFEDLLLLLLQVLIHPLDEFIRHLLNLTLLPLAVVL